MGVDWIRYLHLLSAAVWTGGLIVLAFTVLALRKAGAERPQLQAAARMFSYISWTAMTVSVVTGTVILLRFGSAATNLRTTFGQAVFLKLSLVGLAVGLALWHQMTAGKTSDRTRGMLQGLILLISLAIFAAAVNI